MTEDTANLHDVIEQTLEKRRGVITILGVYPNRANKPRVKVLIAIGETIGRLFLRDQAQADLLKTKISQFRTPVVVTVLGRVERRGEFDVYRIVEWPPVTPGLPRLAEAI